MNKDMYAGAYMAMKGLREKMESIESLIEKSGGTNYKAAWDMTTKALDDALAEMEYNLRTK